MLESAAPHWPALSALLDDALALPPALRAAWLDALPEAARPLRAMLARLLDSQREAEAEDFLVTLPRVVPASEPGPASAALAAGSVIGPYRLLRELGAGGMGSVWLAERADGLLKRPVALKLPHAGLATQTFAERLGRERDILASLSHPHIARLYDAGVSTEGRPYLALEYIDGRGLLAHAQAAGLGVRERLQLFLQVLSAVQYAHTQLVIHRDLKPGNVLVDEQGQVRLLDFGIAKLLGEQGRAPSTELTEWGGRAMTPDYASPEQIAGVPLGTASDVYSLGVLLFELLTGARPYRLQRGSRAELEEAILGAEPRRPSDAAPPALKRALRGDLDAIIGKALAKAPEQRYATAEALQLDLQRHLAGEPVQAQPERRWVLAAKYVRRHRWAFGGGLAVLLLLSGALALALWQARQARIEARTAKAVQTFIEDIFALNDRDNPDPVQARETTARQLLDRAADRIDGELADVPQAKLHMLELMAQLYSDYRITDRAVALERKVVALTREQLGPDHPKVALALSEMAEVMSRFPESSREQLAALEEAAAILARHPDEELALQSTVQRRLANHWTELDNARAAGHAEAAVALARRLQRADAPLAEGLMTLGLVYEVQGQMQRAEAALTEAGRVIVPTLPAARMLATRQHAYLARVLQRAQKYPEAEAQFRAALALARSSAGELHADTIQTELRLGNFLAETGRLHEALAVLQSAELRAQRSGAGERPVMLVLGPRAVVQARLGQLEEGLTALRERLAEYQHRGTGSASHGQLMQRLALTLIELGQQAEARTALDQAGEMFRHSDPAPPVRRQARLAEAAWWLAEGRPDEAVRRLGPAEPGEDATVALARADLLLAGGDAAAAAKAAHAAGERLAASPVRDYLAEPALQAQAIEGRALAAAGRCVDALLPLQQATNAATRLYDEASSPVLADLLLARADCELALGHRAAAQALVHQAAAIHVRHPQLSAQHRAPLRRLQARLGLPPTV